MICDLDDDIIIRLCSYLYRYTMWHEAHRRRRKEREENDEKNKIYKQIYKKKRDKEKVFFIILYSTN